MKNNSIFLGFFIIVFAILFLIGKINFSLLFPVFIIFLGLSIMPQKEKITKVALIIFAMSCLGLMVVDLLNETKKEVSFLPIEIYNNIESPNIFFSVESGNILISGFESDKLIQGSSKTNFSKSGSIVKGNQVFLNFEGPSWREDAVNQIEVLINKEKEVDLNIDSFLSVVNVEEINHRSIKTTSFLSDIILEIDKSVNIETDSFLSAIRIFIPSNSGVRIENNLVASSINFNGLLQMNEKVFQTQDYEEREVKINLKTEGLFSSLTIIEK